jgi:hypothetical protein
VCADDGRIEISQLRAQAGGVTPSEPNASEVTTIEITATGVVLDLGGHTILGPKLCTDAGPVISCGATGLGVGIADTGTDNVVRNGRVLGSGLVGISLGDRGRIEGVSLLHNTKGGLLCDVGCVIVGSVARLNGSHGFSLGDHGLVLDSQALDNGTTGISGGSGLVVRGNLLRGNNGSGVFAGPSSAVLGNSVRGNASGLQLDATAGYAHNSISSHTGLAVIGGVNIEGNACDTALCP